MTSWPDVRRLFDDALDLPPHERRAFLERATDDAALVAEVEALLAADAAEEHDARLEPPRRDDDLRGARLGPWRIVEPIASGGMGAVFRGVRADDAFEKAVAIKVVKRGLDTREVLRRFRQERRVLADLDHAHIARLLDAGSTDDGRPYLVMEHVDGRPLDVVAAELDVRARLRLVIATCRAVHHAHSALVLHRDLKPANVLVTDAGEPKLLDFGIAKVLDPDDGTGVTATLGASAVMTPDHASPEQLRGERLSTASDVWALGVMLYEVLTGRHPFPDGGATIARRLEVVETTTPRPPSRAVGGLPRDVDVVVGKALHVEPARRYASAEQLAEDLERVLAREPVVARPDSWRYRAATFVRRHRAAVVASAAVVLALTAALVASVRERDRAERLAASLADANARTRRRYDEARAVARTLLFDLDASLARIDGTTRARRELVDTGLRYLEGLADEAGDDVGLLEELARGRLAIAAILGGDGAANLGDHAAAARSLDAAVHAARRARELSPGDAALVVLLADALERRAAHGGRDDDLREALALLEVAEDAPSALPVRARVLVQRAARARDAGELDDARSHAAAAVDVEDRLSSHAPERAVWHGVAARRELAQLEALLGDTAAAEATLSAALETITAEVAVAPDDRLLRRELGAVLGALGLVVARSGRLDEGVEWLELALEHNRAALTSDPSDDRARRDAWVVAYTLVQPLLGAGREADALDAARECVRLAPPDDEVAPRARADRLASHQALARALAANDRHAEAWDVAEPLVGRARALADAAPDDAEARRNLAIVLWDRARIARSRSADDDAWLARARDDLAAALDVLEQLDADGRLAPGDRRALDGWARELEDLDARLVRR